MIFVDSSFFIALSNKRDQWHKKAIALSRRIDKEDALFVSDLIISETVTGIGKLKGGKEGKILFDYITDNCEIQYLDMKLCDKAIETFLKYDGTLSFADSVSIEIMRQKGISEIASFDRDFDKVKGIIRIY